MNWDQLQAILWLRWRLTRNQFARGGHLNAVVAIMLLTILLFASAGFAIGSVFLGAFIGVKAGAQTVLLTWDALFLVFLFFWLAGLMVEIQRSESIDLTRLLHLPVTLGQVFAFNYAASHFTPVIVLFLPAMIGLCVGLTCGDGLLMALMLPVVLSLVFLITAWTYCLRGWLAALMINKRRRRTIIVWITLVFVLVCQLPNVLLNSSLPGLGQRRAKRFGSQSVSAQREESGLPQTFVQAHLVLPPGWAGYSAMALKQRSVLPALATTALSLLIGSLGLIRAFRLTIRFYRGVDEAGATIPVAQVESGPRQNLLVERRLPWLPDDVAALTLATFRSALRAPELKMAAVMPLVFGVMLVSTQFARHGQPLSETLRTLAATGAVMVAAFSLAPAMSNMFGLDRNGFRALVLLPTRRDSILLAKNLAILPFTAATALLFLVLGKLLLGIPAEPFLAGLLHIPAALFLISLTCNLIAILAPYRLAPGTLQARKPKPIIFLAVFMTFFFMPLVLLPVMVPAALQILCSTFGWLPWLPVNSLASAGLLAGTVLLYWAALPSEGRLLQRRERAILRQVTEEVE